MEQWHYIFKGGSVYSNCVCNGKMLIHDPKDYTIEYKNYPDYESCKKICKDTKGCQYFGVWYDKRLKLRNMAPGKGCVIWNICDKCHPHIYNGRIYKIE